MDPNRGHGLGTGFIARMLKLSGAEVPVEGLRVRSVQCEAPGRTRAGKQTLADIVVWGRGFTLVIENKVDAKEQEAQCKRLHECFGQPGTYFMFLSPDRDPTTDKYEVFRPVRYRQVSRELEAALKKTPNRSATDRGLAENYLLTLQREFG